MTSELPSSLLSRLSFLLGKLYFRALDLESQGLDQLGIDVKQQAALALLADEGPMSQQELGHRLSIDRTTIVAVVDGLDDRGLLERRRSPVDRRAYQLTLTSAGRDAQHRGQSLVDIAEQELLAALSKPDRRALIELLARALRRGDEPIV